MKNITIFSPKKYPFLPLLENAAYVFVMSINPIKLSGLPQPLNTNWPCPYLIFNKKILKAMKSASTD